MQLRVFSRLRHLKKSIYWLVMVAIMYSSGALAQPSGEISSPYSPPAQEYGRITVNSGEDLDTECRFSPSGDIVSMFEVPEYINSTVTDDEGKVIDPSGLDARKVLRSKGKLTMPMFDVDRVAPGFDSVEIDEIYINGTLVGEAQGADGAWVQFDLEFDADILKFGKTNELRIVIDTASSEPSWCTALDWYSIKVDVALPLAVVHGVTSSFEDSYNAAFITGLNAYGFKWQGFSLGPQESVLANGTNFDSQIDNFLEPINGSSINIIAHSKGGLDTQAMQALGPDFEIKSLLTLSTPHLGSILADLSVIVDEEGRLIVDDETDPENILQAWVDRYRRFSGLLGDRLPQQPALGDLTTHATLARIASNHQGNIEKIYAIGANADIDNDQRITSPERMTISTAIDNSNYQVLGLYSSARVTGFREVEVSSGLLGRRTRRLPVLEGTLNAQFADSDIVVTTDSARPGYAIDLGVVNAHHGTVKNFEFVEDYLKIAASIRD